MAGPPRAAPPGRIVIVGLGNAARRDDGAGVESARRLARSLRDRAEVLVAPGDPAELVERWDGAGLAIAVDAVRSGQPPGSIVRWDPLADRRAVPSGTHSTHGLSLGAAVGLGRALGRLPGSLRAYGIEAGDVGPGWGLSPPVDRAVAIVVAAIERTVAAGGRAPDGAGIADA
ncbi:MAG TPA: hydrogenase maturation protease [Thermoplasmata archaeon]|nr:hydrogenase maturation protease [Thermoplasmata archaeon]